MAGLMGISETARFGLNNFCSDFQGKTNTYLSSDLGSGEAKNHFGAKKCTGYLL
jgi:hypothetical protein